jgi:hypothetical protein
MPQAMSEGPLGAALLYLERGDLAAARPLLASAVDGGVGANASLGLVAQPKGPGQHGADLHLPTPQELSWPRIDLLVHLLCTWPRSR